MIIILKLFDNIILYYKENCTWSEWTPWSACSADCDAPGIQYRTRKSSSYSSDVCEEPSLDTRVCEKDPVTCNCIVSEWEEWTPCSKECGSGISKRSRKIVSPNKSCNVTLTESKLCNTDCCPVDGKWSVWNQWSECSAQCNSGLRTRTRSCSNPKPQCNGAPCNGSDSQVEPCNTQPCSKYYLLFEFINY